MATLTIYKDASGVWPHQPSDYAQFVISQFNCKVDGIYFRVNEKTGSQRARYLISQVTVIDQTDGDASFTYTDTEAGARSLMSKLKELGYPAFIEPAEVVIADLISSDAENALTEGTDGKLFVPAAEAGGVNSVNGETGAVTLTQDDIPDGTTYKQFSLTEKNNLANQSGVNTGDNSPNTNSNAYADGKVADAINDGTTTIAPSQNAVFDALALKANLDSPALTGTPTAPTAAASTNTTQIATTAFVQQETANDVVGPASATDNAVAKYDSTTGKVIQNSNLILDDDGGLTFAGQASPTYGAGKLVYDTTNESLTFYNNDANVALQVGQELWIPVRNISGSTIPNGSAVYVNGSSLGLPTIALAQANALSTSVVAGLTTEAIPNNATGYVTSVGTVRGLNTSSFSAGNIFLSATTPGALTQTIPTSPNYRYRVGFVTNVNATTGTIHVTPSTAAVGNGTQGQVLSINSAGNQLWRSAKSGMFPTANFTYAVTSGTLTKAFNVGTGSGGAFNADARTYFFDGFISLSGLSSTSGNVQFGFLGTATVSSLRYTPLATKAAVPSAALSGNITVATTTAVTTSTTTTTAILRVTGMIRLSASGTLIPAISASQSAGSVVTEANSWFAFEDLGANNATASSDIS